MVTYAGEACLCYSREVNEMADEPMDPTDPPDPDAIAAPAPPDDAAQRESYLRHVYSHPYARQFHEGMAAQYGAAAMPSGTNGLPPAAGAAPTPTDSPVPFQRELDAQRYQREVEAARAETGQLRQQVNALRYERDLTQLVSLGYEFDLAEELSYCRDMTPEQFAAHVKRVKRNYARGPAGGPMVRTLEDEPETRREGVISEAEKDRAVQYMRENNCSWPEAVEKSRARAAVNGRK
jgi:hypothetical protein